MSGLCLFLALCVAGFGYWNQMKAKRVLAAPFKKTGELKANPTSDDPKKAMSTEGAIVPPPEVLLSPCSKTPCFYYEIKVERQYEKTETTQEGTKTSKSWTSVGSTITGGSRIELDDGSGPFAVDFTKGGDVDTMKETFKKELNGRGWASQLQFGEFSFDVPIISEGKGEHTIGFRCTETTASIGGSMFVLGALEGDAIVKPSWRSLMASHNGREGLLGSLEKKKKFSYIGGGVLAFLAIPMYFMAPEPAPYGESKSCESAFVDARKSCSDNLSSKSGETHNWSVKAAGHYTIKVDAPAKAIGFAPGVSVTLADGTELTSDGGGIGGSATLEVDVPAGEHKIKVFPSDGYMVDKGGFTYDFSITSAGGAAPAAPALPDNGGAAPADPAAAPPADPAAAPVDAAAPPADPAAAPPAPPQ